jgi:hypothetical protein
MKRVLAACIVVLLACGCARSRVSSASMGDAKEVCIIENPRVRSGFLEAYQQALAARGYSTKLLSGSSSLSACPIVSKYVAYWGWDVVLYLQSASLYVYRDGRPAGHAVFDARSSRLFSTEGKLRELVAQLYP